MPDALLNFPSPICYVQPQKRCELTTGARRFESHIERKWIAIDHHGRLPEPRKDPLAANLANGMS
jgi:hypothetical protein